MSAPRASIQSPIRFTLRSKAFIPSGMSLSEAMMQKYDDYGEQLKIYHELEHSVSDDSAAKLRGAYRDYNDNIIKRDEFYNKLKKILSDMDKENVDQDVLESCGKLKKLIDENKLFIRQRTAANGVLPHQLHQIEMRKIIDNQKEYYPWLAEPNPNEKRRVYSKYKVEELIAFRIPYYVGPLVDPNNADKNKEARFSWMVRKKDGEITPWNFDDKVDRAESANNFIERMKSKDTYLLGEDVVPKESMLYQKYEVLNELNNVRINDNGLSDSSVDVNLKQAIYSDLFKKYKVESVNGKIKVTVKDVAYGKKNYTKSADAYFFRYSENKDMSDSSVVVYTAPYGKGMSKKLKKGKTYYVEISRYFEPYMEDSEDFEEPFCGWHCKRSVTIK